MNKKQLKDCYALWKSCFHDTEVYMDYYFNEKVKDNHILTLYDNETLTSMLHLNPYQIHIDGLQIPANYIVGVATDKNYRKQGRMRILMKQALEIMYQEKQGFTYLMPADEKIYKPFDFHYIYEQTRCLLQGVLKREEEKLLQAAQLKVSIQMVDYSMLSQIQLSHLLDYVDNKLKACFDVYTVHTKNFYSRLYQEMTAAGGGIKLFLRGDVIIGIISYMLEDNKIEITELIMEKEDSLEIVNQFLDNICIMGRNYDVELFETFFVDKEALKLNYNKVSIINKPIIMARIVHLVSFIRCFRVNKSEEKIIKLVDELIAENNGIWKITLSSEGCDAVKTDVAYDCVMTIIEIQNYFLSNKNIYINEIV